MTITEKVKIVVRLYDNMCFPINGDNQDKYLESTISWARGDYEIIECDNNDFNLSIEESAENSSQGGKLSFWKCSLSHPNIKNKLYVGIKSDFLVNIIKSYNVYKGCITDNNFNPIKFKFYFNIKEYCPITEDNEDINYKKYLSNVELIKQHEINKQNTIKVKCKDFIPYNVYYNSYRTILYLGKFNIFDLYENKRSKKLVYINDLYIKTSETNNLSDILFNSITSDTYCIESVKSISPLCDKHISIINDLTDDKIKELDAKIIKYIKELPHTKIYYIRNVITNYFMFLDITSYNINKEIFNIINNIINSNYGFEHLSIFLNYK
ncbi:MAG: hypothetical protein RSE41_10090 [Clostridia bacterium]